MTDARLDPPEHLHIEPTGFQLAPSHLTLDDPEGSEIKVKLFDVKYVKNGMDDLQRLKVKVTNGRVTAIGMWRYTPVRTTGVLVCLFVFFVCPQNLCNRYLVRGST